MRGFLQSLVLVIASMIAGSMLLPTIMRLRENFLAMRSACNYATIGVGFNGYAASKDHFPPATVANQELPPERRLSWMADLLPFVVPEDEQPLEVDRSKAWDEGINLVAAKTKMSVYVCAANPNQPISGEPCPAHYVGIAGVGMDAASLSLQDPRAGFFGHDRKPKLDDFRRGHGLSNTIAIIGTASMNGPWVAGGWATVRPVLPGLRPHIGPNRAFGGVHRGYVRIGMADTSVHVISESVNPEVFEAMATIRERVPPDRILSPD